ncbi:MAG: hypothetical protein AAB656_00460, partial [Patescibacteria group bacterium]
MNKKIALVTDLKVVDSPQAGLGVARCLKSSGFKVIGVDDTPLVTQNKELFDKVFCWEEIRTLNFDSLIKKLIDVKNTYGLDYIFPCYDETAILFSFIKDKLDFLGIKLLVPSKDVLKSLRKENLTNIIGASAKYCTPKRQIISNIEEAKKFANSLGFPVICKGLTKSAFICKNENDLEQNVKRISDIWNGGEIACIIEEYISGKYVNCIVGMHNNKIVGFVEMQKIGLDQNGATWFGKIRKTQELLPLAQKLVKENDFSTSVIQIETIEKDGKYYVYEINPRTPAWVYAPNLLGLNLPELITKEGDGENIKFVKEEAFFGREVKDFIRKDIQGY